MDSAVEAVATDIVTGVATETQKVATDTVVIATDKEAVDSVRVATDIIE